MTCFADFTEKAMSGILLHNKAKLNLLATVSYSKGFPVLNSGVISI